MQVATNGPQMATILEGNARAAYKWPCIGSAWNGRLVGCPQMAF